MKTLAFIALLILASLPAASAQAQDLILHDSTYYTLGDGVMDENEMMEEADGMYQLCDMNGYQKKYFDCGCFAGAYLQQREKLGPIATQGEIYTAITNSAKTSKSCAKTAEIAGDVYKECQEFTQRFRELAPDNDQYCTCVANKVASDFTKTPRLSANYITAVQTDAYSFCEDPKNRPKPKQSASTATPAAPLISPDPKSLN